MRAHALRLLAALALAATLHAGPQQAYACFCSYPESDEAVERILNDVPIVVDVTVLSRTPVRDYEWDVQAKVNAVFKGGEINTVTFTVGSVGGIATDCDYKILGEGGRHILALTRSPARGDYLYPTKCASIQYGEAAAPDYAARLARLAPPYVPPDDGTASMPSFGVVEDDEGADRAPWYALAAGIGFVAVGAGMFVLRRRGGRS